MSIDRDAETLWDLPSRRSVQEELRATHSAPEEILFRHEKEIAGLMNRMDRYVALAVATRRYARCESWSEAHRTAWNDVSDALDNLETM